MELRLFCATEQCRLGVSSERDVLLVRPRDPDVLPLADQSISSDPAGIARLRVEDGRLVLVPGTPGTPILVDGTKITDSTELREGDRIRIGFTTIILQSVADAAGDQPSSVKTLSLSTSFVKRREPLDEAADQLSQWSQGFDQMLAAQDDMEAAAVILQQLLRLAGGSRGMIGAGHPPRALEIAGFTAAEAERALRWLGQLPEDSEAATPTVGEVIGADAAARCAVGRHGGGEETWFFVLELPSAARDMRVTYRAMSLMANMLILHRTLHEKKGQQRLVDELRETVRVYAQPAEHRDLEIVRAKFTYQSSAMGAVCRMLARAASAPSPVLITGEPGTGKQRAAEAVHAASGRRHRDMVAVSLVEVPETLVESQLFGHAARIFPGAREHQGFVAKAHGGTLFLDEIGEVPTAIQGKLLRVLEYGRFWKIGAPRESQVDVRLVTATNRDLNQRVRDGRFRQDLLDRISVIPIRLPPLRERTEDIPLLVDFFLDEFNATMGKRVSVAPGGLDFLCRQVWPDNIRGLRNCMERAVVLAESRTKRLRESDLRELLPAVGESSGLDGLHELERLLIDEGHINQSRILRALRGSTGRKSKGEWGAQVGLSRPVFRRELKGLILFCLRRDVPIDFFERRLSLRAEDWEYIKEELRGEDEAGGEA